MKIVAGICAWKDGPLLIRAVESCLDAGIDVVIVRGGIRGAVPENELVELPRGTEYEDAFNKGHVHVYAPEPGFWNSQSTKRQYALEKARALGADWLLQLDTDEQLVHGDQLPAAVAAAGDALAYPLPLFEESVSARPSLAPHKLIRLTEHTRIVAWGSFIWDGAKTWQLFGYGGELATKSDSYIEAIRQGPYLLHTPSQRSEERSKFRLGPVEAQLEAIPTAEPWPIHTGGPMSDTPDTTTAAPAASGTYYCPQCGARADAPGICTGDAEHPHPNDATQMVAVADAQAAEQAASTSSDTAVTPAAPAEQAAPAPAAPVADVATATPPQPTATNADATVTVSDTSTVTPASTSGDQSTPTLEERVTALEERVAKLEGADPAAAAAPPGGWPA